MGFALSDMTLTSSAFDRGEPIPTQHTGEDEDVLPALSWRGQPDGTMWALLEKIEPNVIAMNRLVATYPRS